MEFCRSNEPIFLASRDGRSARDSSERMSAPRDTQDSLSLEAAGPLRCPQRAEDSVDFIVGWWGKKIQVGVKNGQPGNKYIDHGVKEEFSNFAVIT